jgi:hypothetical protein
MKTTVQPYGRCLFSYLSNAFSKESQPLLAFAVWEGQEGNQISRSKNDFLAVLQEQTALKASERYSAPGLKPAWKVRGKTKMEAEDKREKGFLLSFSFCLSSLPCFPNLSCCPSGSGLGPRACRPGRLCASHARYLIGRACDWRGALQTLPSAAREPISGRQEPKHRNWVTSRQRSSLSPINVWASLSRDLSRKPKDYKIKGFRWVARNINWARHHSRLVISSRLPKAMY